MRIGFGFDTHALKEGLPLVIGGIRIPSDKGSSGHSDADVLIHAIIDALFGAAVLGDIGSHFPDTDPAYKGIDSCILLERCRDTLVKEGYRVVNLDCTVCLEKPKLLPFISSMRQRLAEILTIDPGLVSIKAKTSEKLGFIGQGEGLSAYAIVLIESVS